MKNRIILLTIASTCIINNSFCQNNQQTKADSLFIYHFQVLDSLANNNFIDSTLVCIESIMFMELNTKISSNTDGNYFGKISFTNDDLKAWHNWYNQNKENLYWSKKDKIVKLKNEINIDDISQNDTNKIIKISELEADHPLLDRISYKQYFEKDLDKLLTISEEKKKKIEILFNSLNQYLKTDTCLSFDTKKHLQTSIDNLKRTYLDFVNAAHEVEYLSYGKGSEAGYRSLVFKIICQDKFYEFLNYWSSSFYFAYLEEGVFDCNSTPAHENK